MFQHLALKKNWTQTYTQSTNKKGNQINPCNLLKLVYLATTEGDIEMLRELRKHRNWMPRNKRKAQIWEQGLL